MTDQLNEWDVLKWLGGGDSTDVHTRSSRGAAVAQKHPSYVHMQPAKRVLHDPAFAKKVADTYGAIKTPTAGHVHVYRELTGKEHPHVAHAQGKVDPFVAKTPLHAIPRPAKASTGPTGRAVAARNREMRPHPLVTAMLRRQAAAAAANAPAKPPSPAPAAPKPAPKPVAPVAPVTQDAKRARNRAQDVMDRRNGRRAHRMLANTAMKPNLGQAKFIRKHAGKKHANDNYSDAEVKESMSIIERIDHAVGHRTVFRKEWDAPKAHLNTLGAKHGFNVKDHPKGGHVAFIHKDKYNEIRHRLHYHSALPLGDMVRVRTAGAKVESVQESFGKGSWRNKGRFASMHTKGGGRWHPHVPKQFRERMEAMGAKVKPSGAATALVFSDVSKAEACFNLLLSEGINVTKHDIPGVLFIQQYLRERIDEALGNDPGPEEFGCGAEQPGEKLVGGEADGKPDSTFDAEQLEAGVKVEMEHTSDPATAREIAKDHLSEDPAYYSKLKKAGLADESVADRIADALGEGVYIRGKRFDGDRSDLEQRVKSGHAILGKDHPATKEAEADLANWDAAHADMKRVRLAHGMKESATPLASLHTDDYQKRGDNYPKSHVPVDVHVHGAHITANFKNTPEGHAKKWLAAHLAKHGHEVVGDIDTGQDGDYHDDWTSAHAVVNPKVRESWAPGPNGMKRLTVSGLGTMGVHKVTVKHVDGNYKTNPAALQIGQLAMTRDGFSPKSEDGGLTRDFHFHTVQAAKAFADGAEKIPGQHKVIRKFQESVVDRINAAIGENFTEMFSDGDAAEAHAQRRSNGMGGWTVLNVSGSYVVLPNEDAEERMSSDSNASVHATYYDGDRMGGPESDDDIEGGGQFDITEPASDDTDDDVRNVDVDERHSVRSRVGNSLARRGIKGGIRRRAKNNRLVKKAVARRGAIYAARRAARVATHNSRKDA